ncbi:MAG: phosphoribosyl-AMP cyclohydrolase [Chloroflexi bacterium]|nr:phosphoribosyl-AMP cyclohydrolase [Chloroflexota bacterium]
MDTATDSLVAFQLKYDVAGLIPAICQDVASGDILMLGYMNREAVARTLDSGTVWFYSRSRQELWNKGSTSGNYLNVVELVADCDRDALLVKVNPAGPTCHTGARSCFHNPLDR